MNFSRVWSDLKNNTLSSSQGQPITESSNPVNQSDSKAIVKCDVIKIKFVKLWDFRGIMKEHPKGLLAKNQHSRANQPSYALMTPCTNPSKFDSVDNIRNRVKLRRICVESSERNGTRMSQDNLPHNAIVWPEDLSDVVLSKYPTNPINSNIIFLRRHRFRTLWRENAGCE